MLLIYHGAQCQNKCAILFLRPLIARYLGLQFCFNMQKNMIFSKSQLNQFKSLGRARSEGLFLFWKKTKQSVLQIILPYLFLLDWFQLVFVVMNYLKHFFPRKVEKKQKCFEAWLNFNTDIILYLIMYLEINGMKTFINDHSYFSVLTFSQDWNNLQSSGKPTE